MLIGFVAVHGAAGVRVSEKHCIVYSRHCVSYTFCIKGSLQRSQEHDLEKWKENCLKESLKTKPF